MSAHSFRSWVEVSRSQIAENYRALRSVCPDEVQIMAVVKADAYRHGSVEVSRVLEREGARWLAVSSVEEGITLREAGIGTRILVMADFLPAERKDLLAFDLTPVLHSLPDIAALDELAAARGTPTLYHLKIDSGMGRLGTRAEPGEICKAVAACRWARLDGLMTHFASAADYTNPQTDEQIRRFECVKQCLAAEALLPSYIHMGSTIPLAYGRKEAWGNLIRPGHAIYGYISPPRGTAPQRIVTVKPALSWKAAVLTVKDVPEGAYIGYGGMYRAPKTMRIAVLAAGYADGIPHRLSNRGRVIAGGRLVPILGSVSMDVTTIDVTHCPQVRPGDAVTLLGREGDVAIDAQQIARTAGTISYSVLCGISARVKRVYV
jgi:alanine racemase